MKLGDITNKEKIIELYYLYGEDLYNDTETNNRFMKDILKREEELFDTLTEEQKKVFDEIDNLRLQNYEETDKRLFTFAFSLGVRLVLESLDKI